MVKSLRLSYDKNNLKINGGAKMETFFMYFGVLAFATIIGFYGVSGMEE